MTYLSAPPHTVTSHSIGSRNSATPAPLREENPQPLGSPHRRLRIYSPVRGIDNILLCEELERGLTLNCQLISDPRLLADGLCSSTQESLAKISSPAQPCIKRTIRDLVLFDCREVSGLDLQNLLRALPHSTGCALINLTPDSLYERLIEWPQIKGMLYQNTGLQHLLRGVRAMMKGELWLPRHLCHDFLYRRRHEPAHALALNLPSKLTRREREALEGLCAGKTNNALARQLKLSEHTIKSHLYSAYKKIGVKSRLEASNWLRDHYSLLDKLSSP
jgi:DNA-binding NarL/FixJ family response regulator